MDIYRTLPLFSLQIDKTLLLALLNRIEGGINIRLNYYSPYKLMFISYAGKFAESFLFHYLGDINIWAHNCSTILNLKPSSAVTVVIAENLKYKKTMDTYVVSLHQHLSKIVITIKPVHGL